MKSYWLLCVTLISDVALDHFGDSIDWIPSNLQDSEAGLEAGQSETDRQQWIHIQYQVTRSERRLLAVFGEAQSKSLQGIGDRTRQ